MHVYMRTYVRVVLVWHVCLWDEQRLSGGFALVLRLLRSQSIGNFITDRQDLTCCCHTSLAGVYGSQGTVTACIK